MAPLSTTYHRRCGKRAFLFPDGSPRGRKRSFQFNAYNILYTVRMEVITESTVPVLRTCRRSAVPSIYNFRGESEEASSHNFYNSWSKLKRRVLEDVRTPYCRTVSGLNVPVPGTSRHSVCKITVLSTDGPLVFTKIMYNLQKY